MLASSGTDRGLHVWDLRYVYIHNDNYKHLLIQVFTVTETLDF